MSKTNPLNINTVNQYCQIWINGVIDQANQVISAHLDDTHQHNASISKAYVHDYFFVITVNKLCEWLKELRKLRGDLKSDIDKYFSQLPDVKTLRNMREHEIEYLKGKGRFPQKYRQDVAKNIDPNQFSKFEIDAHVTVKTKDISKVIIGGQLDVGLIKQATLNLLSKLNGAF